jgi:hypothetical protein
VNIANAQGVTVGSVVTDESGLYTAGGLTSGTYYAWTSNGGGYVDTLFGGQPCVGGCNVLSGLAIPVTAGVTISGIDIPVGTGGPIAGRLITAPPVNTVQGMVGGTYFPRTLGSTTFTVLDKTITCPAGTLIVVDGGQNNGDFRLQPDGTYDARTINDIDRVSGGIECAATSDPAAGAAIPDAVGEARKNALSQQRQ